MQSETDQDQRDTDCVLIVSTGKNDLQVIGRDGTGKLVARSTGHGGRRLHHYFLNYADVVTEWEETIPGKESRKYYDPDRRTDPSGFPPIKFKDEKEKTEFEPLNHNGRYQLYPGKLTRLIEGLDKHRIKPRAVLVVYTDRPPLAETPSGDRQLDGSTRKEYLRDIGKHFEDEPIATGPLLARWLAAKFGIDIADIAADEGPHFQSGKIACWVNVHKAVTTFEGHDTNGIPPLGPYHYPLALPIARAIDLAVKDLAENLPGGFQAILSHTGGMADLKECLNASVRFRFGNRVVESHESEMQAIEFDFSRDRKLSNTPRRSDSLLSRLHVEQRIWEGDYVGALAVAGHIKPDRVHDNWCYAVQATHDLFLGLESEAYAFFPATARLWNLPVLERDIVLAAFRVEAALQHNKGKALIAEAVNGLVTLRDILLATVLIKKLSGLGIVIDRYSGEVVSGGEYIPEQCKKCFDGKKLKPFANQMAVLLKSLLMVAEESVADHPVIVLNRAIETNRNQKNNKLVYYRNLAIHSTLSTFQVTNCQTLGETQGIWNPRKSYQKSDHLGTLFLGQPMIKNALSVFDLDNLDQCYRSLNDALFSAIREPIALDNG